MRSVDIEKGIDNLKVIANAVNNLIDMKISSNFSNMNKEMDNIHNACVNLTDIFEKEFLDITMREAEEDDGK